MGLFDNFPWSNYQQLNLDWIIRTIKTLIDKSEKTLTIEPQDLSEAEKEQARENIGAGTGEGTVRFDITQNLTQSDKNRAVSNIGALSANSLDSEIARRAITYDRTQNLTESQKATARANIGISESGQTGSVLYDEAQNLTEQEMKTARTNIGATDYGTIMQDVYNSSVLFSRAQQLNETQKAQARANIGAGTGTGSAEGAVLYNTAQSLSTAQQAQARTNIDVYSKGEADSAVNTATDSVVKFTAQSLTEDQKAQARENIGAGTGTGGGFAPTLVWTNPNPNDNFGTNDANSATDVPVTLTGVNWIGIIFHPVAGNELCSPMLIFDANNSNVVGAVTGNFTENICCRRLTVKKSENKITFGYGSKNGDSMQYYANNIGVPYQIFTIG